ncbi:MAG: DUF2073 domain-containing protein [Methanobacteriota archaeon]|nr:MAG: DUF2073 domain-containing protein [Euryarchaeota archaeon]
MASKRKTAKKKTGSGKKGSAEEIRLDFIPAEMLSAKSSPDKLEMILSRVKKNIIVVLEEALTPQEEADLIQQAMSEIDSKEFFGIEFYRIGHREATLLDRISSFLTKRRAGITIVGPTRMVEAIKKEPDHISVFARAGG